jgi:hypothetical protein
MISVEWHELISWLVTVVSVTLLVYEWRRNPRLSYYMALQGVLRACREKAGFYASRSGELERRSIQGDKGIPKEEYHLFVESVCADYMSLMEHIMGTVKAIEPKKDLPFDTKEFLRRPTDRLPPEAHGASRAEEGAG